MQLQSSNLFGTKTQPAQKKLPMPIVLSLIGKADYKGLLSMSDDTVTVIPEEGYAHYLNGQFKTNCNIFEAFDSDVLDSDRVLINIADFKEANKIYDSNFVYDLTGTEDSMRDYLEIEKVLNVIVVNTKTNSGKNNFKLAIAMARAYRYMSQGSSRTLLTDENNIPKAIYSVLSKAEDNIVENVYIYRNNSLVALGVGEFGDEVVLNSIRIIDL